MVAYVIADVHITNPAAYEGYRQAVPDTIAAYGGRYLARGGRTEVLEGDWQPHRVVILEFPTLARAQEWYRSPDYAPLAALRQASATSTLVITEGL
jgi:uncharacterized protein (DUF1330 family)